MRTLLIIDNYIFDKKFAYSLPCHQESPARRCHLRCSDHGALPQPACPAGRKLFHAGALPEGKRRRQPLSVLLIGIHLIYNIKKKFQKRPNVSGILCRRRHSECGRFCGGKSDYFGDLIRFLKKNLKKVWSFRFFFLSLPPETEKFNLRILINKN